MSDGRSSFRILSAVLVKSSLKKLYYYFISCDLQVVAFRLSQYVIDRLSQFIIHNS